MTRAIALLAVVLLTGCALPGFGEVGGGAEPGVVGPAEMEPIGPVRELGSGEAQGVRWRYLTFESRLGTCTQLETAGSGGGGTACGGELGSLPPDRPVTISGMGSGTGMPTVIEGAASDDIAAVVVDVEGGERFPATLMSLAPIGRQGQVFVALVPGDRTPRRVVALDAAGVRLGHEDVMPSR